MKIKKNDKVIVITGKDKGKEGLISKVFPKKDRVLISGINIKKVHQRPRRAGEKGQVLDVPMPINRSNVMILDPKTGKRTRFSHKNIDGKKIRVTKKSGSNI